ncbi:MAG: bifunctional phosphopantothenoylcysteine decarboxylase/phosphopantothenate--cysteine ligase CoaBC, partial [Nitrospinota bacterium]
MSPSPFRDAFLVLGVTGGVAAYKAVELLRLLTEAGAQVQVTMTEHAAEFVRPLSFQVLSGREVISRMFPIEGGAHPGDMPHISLTRRADLVVVAPATANLIGKFAHGIADDFLTTLLLSAPAPVVVAPAMNPRMYRSPLVQANLARLRELGHRIVDPEEGPMASREEEEEGVGRLAAPGVILEAIEEALRQRGKGSGDLAGLRLLVTAGPTREAWDPIRFLSNRSSGRMGYALAARAAARGAQVTLVSGPTSLPPPAGAELIRVETAEE